jgi:pimeloyl-ACP methyl ester carboxylesterase
MFIHDAWLTPLVWQGFAGRFAACGYACVAPAWPGLDQPVARLREQPPARLASLGIGELLAHYQRLIHRLAEAPLLVGHGVGGLLVQMLLDRGLGAAGVAIAPIPPRGVLPGVLALRAALPSLSIWTRIQWLTRARFERDLAQTLSPAARLQAFDSYIVPAPGRVFFQAALGIGCKVDFANDRRAALLFIAGEQDRCVQASMVSSNYRLHRRSVAVTAIQVFPGRSHWLINEPGWEEIADACIDWANEQLGGF